MACKVLQSIEVASLSPYTGHVEVYTRRASRLRDAERSHGGSENAGSSHEQG